jgi:hypothetical protein
MEANMARFENQCEYSTEQQNDIIARVNKFNPNAKVEFGLGTGIFVTLAHCVLAYPTIEVFNRYFA